MVDDADVTWNSPDGNEWLFDPGHFPRPVSRLYVDVINAAFKGRVVGEQRWGLPARQTVAAQVNGYLYFLGDPPEVVPGDVELFDRRRLERGWIDEAERWFDVERPAVTAANFSLQAVDVGQLDDTGLAAHLREAADHLFRVAPLHFEHCGRRVVLDFLVEQAEAEGIDRRTITSCLRGGSPASSRPALLVAEIASALRDSGLDPGLVRSLDDVRASTAAGRALDRYLHEFGYRLLDSYDLAHPTLSERPEVLTASIRAAAVTLRTEPASQAPPMSKELRQLLDEARTSYGIEDDDDGICMFWPSGLLRRAMLEFGRRRPLAHPEHVFEVSRGELQELLDGGGPSPEALAQRAAARAAAESLAPPAKIGAGTPPRPTRASRSDRQLSGEGVGTGIVRGRACVVRGADGLDRIEPGDVLIAVTTTPGYNAVLPIVAAIATETWMTHTVICSRELGIPAVVGVQRLLDAVPDGCTVEVNATDGTVRVLARSGRVP